MGQKTPSEDEPRSEPISASDVKLVRELFLAGLPLPEIAAKFERPPIDVAEVIRQGNAAVFSCSFCGRNPKQVVLLIAGPLAYICDGCVNECIQVIREARPEMIRISIGSESDQNAAEAES